MCQTVFLKLLEKGPELPPDKARAWLFIGCSNPGQLEEIAPLDVERIIAISCQDWYIPITDGQTGPIQWAQP